MTRSGLRLLRVTIVGILAVIAVYSLIDPAITLTTAVQQADPKRSLLILAAVMLTGTAYYMLGARGWIEPGLWKAVDANIHTKIATAGGFGPGDGIPPAATKRSFYQLVDSDPTLSSHAEGIYFNGAVVTGLVDASILALVCSFAHSVLSIAGIDSRSAHLAWAALLLGVDIVASLLLWAALRRHMHLSDVQLELIATHHNGKARELLSEQLHALRHT